MDEILARTAAGKNEFMLQEDISKWALLYLLRLGPRT
jgi:hypothetical protein